MPWEHFSTNVEEKWPLLARPEDIYADAVEQRPGVKAEQLRLAGSDLSIKIAKAGFSPTLSLSGGMGTSYYTNTRSLYPQDGFWQQLSHNFSPYVTEIRSHPIVTSTPTA